MRKWMGYTIIVVWIYCLALSLESETTNDAKVNKPMIQLNARSCYIEDNTVYFDVNFYMENGGDLDDVYLCYKLRTDRKCTRFPVCQRGNEKQNETLTCQGMEQLDPNHYEIYLVNKDVEKHIVYHPFIPVIDRRSCNLSSSDVIDIQKVSETSSSIAVQTNISKKVYANIDAANIEVIGQNFTEKFPCNPMFPYKSSLCNATGLVEGIEYKFCVTVDTMFFKSFTKCIISSTKCKMPERPTKLHAINIPDVSVTVVKWQGDRFNTSEDIYYQYSFVKDGKLIEKKTVLTEHIIHADAGSIFSVQLCKPCNCSIKTTTVIKKYHSMTKTNRIQNGEEEKSAIKVQLLYGILFGVVASALIIAFILTLNFKIGPEKQRYTEERLPQNFSYIHFGDDFKQKITKINEKA